MRRLVILLTLLGFLVAGCSDSTEPEASNEISSDAVAGRATAAIASIITMRADSSVTSTFAEQSTVVAQSQADIGLREGIVTSEATFTLDPNVEDGPEQTEEAAVVGDRAYRRDPGEAWEPSGQTLVEVALPAFEQEGDDISLAIQAIVLAAPAPWIQTTGDDGTIYVSTDEATGKSLEVVIDDQGHLTRIARSQPPFGIEVDEPLRVGAETVFSEFDRTVVELPSDVPPE